VDVRFTKWGGGRHWEFPVTVLGVDEFGVWCGAPAGTRLERPGAAFASEFAWVMLFPDGQPWAASFYDSPTQPISVYVDMTTPPVWAAGSVSMVDLDLDVILSRDGDLLLDDEDEFLERQVVLGYPQDVVDLARGSADTVFASIAQGDEPFRTAGHSWLAALDGH
jgi:predicted RNA-binding protein associated with RNAse of E/G family